MSVDLVLQPAAERSRSMLLYAERLVANAPERAGWALRRLPRLPLDRDGRLSELVVPPVLLRRQQAEVAHVVDHAHAGYLRFLRGPAVVTVHDLIPFKALRGAYPNGAQADIPRRVATWLQLNLSCLNRAAQLVVPSRATARELKHYLGLNARVVPHGIDAVFAREPDAATVAAVRERLGRHRHRRLLLQVSSGYFYKNDAAVLKAFAALSERFDDVDWVRVGSPLAPELRSQVARSPWRRRYVELGALAPTELAALYRIADVLLFPSWDEGFGWPPLEAMAAGCPVVASDRGALAETVGGAGLIGDPGDPAGLAVLAARVLRDGELAIDLRERGKAQADRFRWDRAAAAMADIYAEAARCA